MTFGIGQQKTAKVTSAAAQRADDTAFVQHNVQTFGPKIFGHRIARVQHAQHLRKAHGFQHGLWLANQILQLICAAAFGHIWLNRRLGAARSKGQHRAHNTYQTHRITPHFAAQHFG
jgi:hypothetical protein